MSTNKEPKVNNWALKEFVQGNNQLLNLKIPLREWDQVANKLLMLRVLGRHTVTKEADWHPGQVNLIPPARALKDVRKSKKTYCKLLQRVARELKRNIFPALSWSKSNFHKLSKFQKLPELLNITATLLEQTEITDTKSLPFNSDRRTGDRSYDASIRFLVRYFKRKTGYPKFLLAADVINYLFKTDFADDEIKKIIARDSCRQIGLAKKPHRR